MKKVAKKPVKQVKKAIAPKKVAKPKKLVNSNKSKTVSKVTRTTIKLKVSPAKNAKVTAKQKTGKIKAVTKKKTTTNKVKIKKTTNTISTKTAKVAIAKKMLKKPIIGRTTAKTSAGPADVKPYQAKPGEEYMNTTQLQHFKNILLAWKEQLLEEAETTKQDIQATSANFPDPVDRASLEEEFNLELRARDRERKLIKKIEEALQQIAKNSYGYCDDCGTEIGVRRLEARPTATQCIECKTVSEMKEKQVGEIGREEE